MRLILLFSALLAALTGVTASARTAETPAVEQRAAAAKQAVVAVVATLRGAAVAVSRRDVPAAGKAWSLPASAPLYQDRLLE